MEGKRLELNEHQREVLSTKQNAKNRSEKD